MKNLYQAGKLFLWEAKQKPALCKLPENIIKASVGPEHVLALG